jgi:hypothetical protein
MPEEEENMCIGKLLHAHISREWIKTKADASRLVEAKMKFLRGAEAKTRRKRTKND